MAKQQDADVAFIEALARLLRKHDLTEVEVAREEGEDRDLKVRLSRLSAQVEPAPAAAPPAQTAIPVPPATSPAATKPAPEDPALHPGAVTSPMVGTVYLSPEPGATNFIKIGDRVNEGQTLLIVEAMKTMNQIPSPRAGAVKRIMVEDGQAVEFGAPLVIVE